MIIKYTFNDNDFTQIIEKYLDEYGPFFAFNFKTNDEYHKFIEMYDQYNDYTDKYNEEKTITKKEFKKLKEDLLVMLKENFIKYIADIAPNSNWYTPGFDAKYLQGEKQYIYDNIEIELVDSIPDQWENGEVVFFISGNKKYITM